MAGLLIAIEGGEGSGKSSGIRLIRDALIQRGVAADRILLTREPGGTPLAEKVRDLLLDRANLMDGWTELALLCAGRADHLDALILPAIAANKVVLVDRFLGSTASYQGHGRGLGEEAVYAAHRALCRGVMPDFTVFMHIPPAEGIARSLKRLGAAGEAVPRFEREELAFHERVADSLLRQSERLCAEGKAIAVDAREPQAGLVERIADHLFTFIEQSTMREVGERPAGPGEACLSSFG